MKVFLTVSCVLCLATSSLCLQPFLTPFRHSNGSATLVRPTSKAGEPLLLTPLINAGRISEALRRSKVSLMPQLDGNAGFLTVNRTFNSNLFFWLCKKAGSDWAAAPLVLWLQGGPGCSSLYGLFFENGPFMVRKSVLQRRRYAWTNRYNVLYIDQPVGTGFSFTDAGGYISSQEQVGQHLYEALTQFYRLFPELKKNDFYISGESYAGKYIPAFGYTIHQRNREPKASRIPLKGMFIGNGWTDPPNMLGYPEYLHRLGFIDNRQRRKFEVIQEQVETLIRGRQWINAANMIDRLFDAIFGEIKIVSPYDYMQLAAENEDTYVEYLNGDDVRKSIHVGQQVFKAFSPEVYSNLEADIMQSVKPWVEELLEHYPMVFFSGQLDVIVAYPLSENFLQKLRWSAADEYSVAERRIWRVGNHVAGHYKSAGNLVDALVRNAGHMVPDGQPRYALDLLVKFVEGKLKSDERAIEHEVLEKYLRVSK